MKRFQKILVVAPAERTSEAACWLDHVVRAARPREVDWRVMVDEAPELPDSSDTRWSPEEEGAPATAELRSHEWPAGFDLRIEALADSGDRQLLRALGDGGYDLVVVPCMPVGFRPLAEKLCRKAPCSVLVLPPGATTRPVGLQVAVDFSEFSGEALEVGGAFARGLEFGQARALHSWWLSERSLRSAMPYEEVLKLVEKAADRKLRDFVARHAPPDLDWRTELLRPHSPARRSSRPRAGVRTRCWCSPHRGKNALAEALLGSTAAEVIRGVECPCLIVKRKGAGIGILRDLLEMLLPEPAS